MSNRRGFTLVELLGVVVILAAVALIVFPPIVNQIKKSNKDLDDALSEIIYTATEQYLSDRNYEKTGTYCIKLNELVKDGKLSVPIRDSSGNEKSVNSFFVVNYGNGKKELYNCIGSGNGCFDSCDVTIPSIGN